MMSPLDAHMKARKKDRNSTPPPSIATQIITALFALAGVVLFLLPITDVRWWTADYLLFLSFIFAVPALLRPGKAVVLRVVTAIVMVAYLGFNQLQELHVPGGLEVVLFTLGVLILIMAGNVRRVRSLVILFSLAYFGALQASCPRLPGAMELILLHLFDDNTIIMHVIKVSAVVGMGLLFGRYYCGWICPKGVIQEYIYRDRVGIKVPPKLDRALKLGKYLMLAALIVFPLAFEMQLFRHIGPFRVIFNLDGALYAIIFLGVVLLSSMFIERAYCRYFCPEGGLLALAQLISPNKMRFDKQSCTRCGRCVKVCPVDAFVLDGKCPTAISSTECIACLECQEVCRDGSLAYGFRPFSKQITPQAGETLKTACEEGSDSE